MKQVLLAAFHVAAFFGLAQEPLFKLIDADKSGIQFQNDVVDTREVNPFLYDNIYSGSGVAMGDLNNDGLLDIYFGGNQVSDQLYINKGKLRFKNITSKAGINGKNSWTTGVTMVDINQDGWLDIYVCKSLYDDPKERRTNELYINNGDLTFTESAKEYGLDDTWRSQQAVFFDYDKDNDLDLFLVNQPPNPGMLSSLKGKDWRYPALGCRLLKNDNGTFKDVSQEANVFDRGYGLSATTGDFNNDGWPDLYVSNDYNNPDFLYINQKDGTFENTIDKSMGHISYFSMGIDVADINNDRNMDILTVDMVPEDNYNLKANMGGMYPAAFWATVEDGGHYQYMLNTLQLNRGVNADGINVFSEIAQFMGIAYTDWSWSPLIADFNNDGYKDIFISNGLVRDLRNTDALADIEAYLQKNIEGLQEARNSNGKISMWDKVSLDTLLSFYPVRKISNYAFKNEDGLNFEKSTEDWGLDLPAFSTGAAYGDLDNDGDLDLVVSNINDPIFLYENTTQSNRSLRVYLETPGILTGTKVYATIGNEVQTYEFANTRGFYSASELTAHFGLGGKEQVDQVIVAWNDGTTTSMSDVKAGSVTIKKKGTVRESQPESIPYFTSVSLFPDIEHRENPFDDYEREVLLPHQMSMEGPILGATNEGGSINLYLPGPKGSKGTLLRSELNQLSETKKQEEVAALFFDPDNDGDDDLYVVTGGNEFSEESEAYLDIFYENQGGNYSVRESFPKVAFSGSFALNHDFDGDGDQDLFVGGRQIPGRYPSHASSYLFKNNLIETGKLSFEDVTSTIAPELKNIGMITSGVWSDTDADGDSDLILVGEWTSILLLINEDNKFSRVENTLSEETGWWNHIAAADLDNDGDEDFLLGNLGLNYKFAASKEEPFVVYYDDFDKNGNFDIVLGYYNFGDLYPVRGRSCSSQQIPEIKKKFQNYHTFASANIFQVYGEEALNQSLTLEVTNFQNSYVENLGNGEFKIMELPTVSQLAPINTSVFYDLNSDGLLDIIYAGNKYGSEVETPRADAGIGGVLINKGNMAFEPIQSEISGLYLNFNVKDMKVIQTKGQDYLIVASNNDKLRSFKIQRNGQSQN